MPKMSEEHKKALAEGRRQARAVKTYLEALNTEASSQQADEDSLKERIAQLQIQIDEDEGTIGSPVKRVELIQRRLDYEEQLANLEEAPDLEALENDFKSVVRDYSERKGISYKAWREIGVPASVLRDAGLSRGFNPDPR